MKRQLATVWDLVVGALSTAFMGGVAGVLYVAVTSYRAGRFATRPFGRLTGSLRNGEAKAAWLRFWDNTVVRETPAALPEVPARPDATTAAPLVELKSRARKATAPQKAAPARPETTIE